MDLKKLYNLCAEEKPIALSEVEAIVKNDPDAVMRKFPASEWADAEDEGDQGWVTPLWMAASNGHTEVLRFLISKGADVNDVYNIDCLVQRAIDIAAEGGHAEIVQVLVDAGAKPGYVLDMGNTAEIAAYHNKPDVLRVCTSAGIGPVDTAGLESILKQKHNFENLEDNLKRRRSKKAKKAPFTLEGWLSDKPELRAAIQENQTKCKENC
mmetsp:Transcript_4538/g.6435  ORF Transcript_4538/g.6435 Transcript_4538/m.6435 type:complete len:210 (-) Transcript_4538:306-935(-)